MKLKNLNTEFSIVQLRNIKSIDFSIQPLFIAHTVEELSVVLPTRFVPAETIKREDAWCGFKVEGILDFSLVGILAKIATALADASISIFANSTYNTDYILVKKNDFGNAVKVLLSHGYRVED